MDASEVHKLTTLEDTHWWYRERRHLLTRSLNGLVPGAALDVGAAGGGNTRVLRDLGWMALALEYGEVGAKVASSRGLDAVRADATALPIADNSLDLVVAFDVLEHIVDDHTAVSEISRVLRPGGTFLVAVPADPKLWSAHDEAVDHVRRYTRSTLSDVLSGELNVTKMESWNVLLRPIAAARRRWSTGSDLEEPHPLVNVGLRAVIASERFLPLGNFPGVSLLATARKSI